MHSFVTFVSPRSPVLIVKYRQLTSLSFQVFIALFKVEAIVDKDRTICDFYGNIRSSLFMGLSFVL